MFIFEKKKKERKAKVKDGSCHTYLRYKPDDLPRCSSVVATADEENFKNFLLMCVFSD